MMWAGTCVISAAIGLMIGLPIGLYELWVNYKRGYSLARAAMGALACVAPLGLMYLIIYIWELLGYPLAP